MDNGAGPLISLVVALVAGAIGGPQGRSVFYGALSGAVVLALWNVVGLQPQASATAAAGIGILIVYGAVQGSIWGAIWGGVGGFFTRKRTRTETPSSK